MTTDYSPTCQYLGPAFDVRTHDYVGGVPVPYCGCKTTAMSNYCEEHHSVVYAKGTALRKRHKDQRRADAIRQLVSDIDAAVQELEAEGFDFDAPPLEEVV